MHSAIQHAMYHHLYVWSDNNCTHKLFSGGRDAPTFIFNFIMLLLCEHEHLKMVLQVLCVTCQTLPSAVFFSLSLSPILDSRCPLLL